MKNWITSSTNYARELKILLTRVEDQACSSSDVEHPPDELANLSFAEVEDDDLYADKSNPPSPIDQSRVQLFDETFLLNFEKDSDMDEVGADFTATNATVKEGGKSSMITLADKIHRVPRKVMANILHMNRRHLVADAKSNGIVLPEKNSGSSSVFLTSSEANDHVTVVAGESHHACSYCNASFTSSAQLTLHLNIHTAGTSSTCQVGNHSFDSDVLQTNAVKPNAQELSCSICNESFQSKTYFYYHNLIHEREKQLSLCSSIPESCKTRVNAEDLSVHKQNLFTCSVCDKSFATKNELEKHSNSHYFKLFTCSDCGKLFKTKNDYEEHCRIHDEETNYFKLFTCSDCGKLFKTKNDYEVHCRIHDEKRISCSICKKTFYTANELEIHSCTHCQEFPTSSICDESLKSGNDREEHATVHNEKPFMCSVCRESFTMANELENHSSAHSQERFTCSDCGMRFTMKNDFENHCSTHSRKPIEPLAVINDITKVNGVHSEESLPCINNVESFAMLSDAGKHCDIPNQRPVSCTDKGESLVEMDDVDERSAVLDRNLSTNSDGVELLVAENGSEKCADHSGEPLTCSDDGVKNDVPKLSAICNQQLLTSSACNELSTFVNDLAKHSEIHKELTSCSMPYSDWVPLETTLEEHPTIPLLYTCCTCGKTCASKAQLTTHMLNHSSETPFICVTCNCAFTMKHSYEEHVQKHTEKSCELCDQSVESSMDLDYPNSINLQKERLSCSVCCDPKNDLNPQFPCFACSDVFPSRKSCFKHYSKMHTRKPFKCSQCQKSFVLEEFFEKHCATHFDAQLCFTCSVCWRSFSAAHKLKKHSNAHKEKLLSCSVCGKRFSTQFALQDHQTSHSTNKKRITGAIRGKSYGRKHNLNRYQAFSSNGEWRIYN